MAQAAAELEKLFAAVDSWYVDGAIKLPPGQRRSSLGGDDHCACRSPARWLYICAGVSRGSLRLDSWFLASRG
jgi:hypothetical protein